MVDGGKGQLNVAGGGNKVPENRTKFSNYQHR